MVSSQFCFGDGIARRKSLAAELQNRTQRSFALLHDMDQTAFNNGFTGCKWTDSQHAESEKTKFTAGADSYQCLRPVEANSGCLTLGQRGEDILDEAIC